MRFSENPDEPRVAAAFGSGKSYAAAVAAATVPGLHLFYDGQTTGKKIRLLIQLGREPEEKEDKETAAFYKLLLNSINQETCHKGEWQMIPFSPAWAGNINDQSLLAWAWHHDRKGMLVIINYSSVESQARIHLPEDWIKNDLVVFYDKFSDNRYERHSKELRDQGLYVDLKPWKFHFFEFEC